MRFAYFCYHACRGGRDGTAEETFEISVVSETSPLAVLGEFKDWMALAFVRQILMFDKFAPGILAVIKGRTTGGTPVVPGLWYNTWR